MESANSMSGGNLPPDAINSLGRPDGGHFDRTLPDLDISWPEFGGQNRNFNTSSGALGFLLGISETLLARADFIAFENNGVSGLTFESSTWIFSDGINSLTVNYAFEAQAAGPILAVGNISISDYAAFFGFTDPGNSGDWAYILFEVDGVSNVDVLSPGFTTTLRATGLSETDSPDLDALARIVTVAEPSMVALFGTTFLSLITCWQLRRRQMRLQLLSEQSP
jgi:hypothetical protein